MDTRPEGTTRTALVAVAGTALGAAIWFSSPYVTGEKEPWDSEGGYYLFALVVAGVLSATVCPRRFWIAPIGVYVGQLAYMITFLPPGPLTPLGVIILIPYSLPSLIGAAVVYAFRRGRDFGAG